MRIFRQYAALSLLILFEIAAGILLLWSPGGVAAAVLFLFGIVMVVIGGMNLVRFFKEKPEGFGGFLVCMVGVAALGVGVFSLIPSTQGMLLHYVAILYALIFFVAGLYEAQMFFSAKKADRPVSVMLLVSAILAIVFGVLVAVNQTGELIPFLTVDQLAAVCMFLEAAADLTALILAIREGRIRRKRAKGLIPAE